MIRLLFQMRRSVERLKTNLLKLFNVDSSVFLFCMRFNKRTANVMNRTGNKDDQRPNPARKRA